MSSESHEQILALENKILRRDLAYARSHGYRMLLNSFKYKLFSALVASRLPISERTRARFRKSAQKRDPLRSLIGVTGDIPALPGRASASGAHRPEPPTELDGVASLAGRIAFDAGKSNILLVTHEASWTGAPILVQNIARELCGRFNVTLLCMRGGNLLDVLADVSVKLYVVDRLLQRDDVNWKRLAQIFESGDFRFAIVNSIESRRVLPLLREKGVPSLTLLHEFASYTLPRNAFVEALHEADQVVYSTSVTLQNAVDITHIDPSPKVHVLPQGKCVVPARHAGAGIDMAERERLRKLLRPATSEGDILVLGAGTVQLRKGIDLFIEAARKVRATPGGERFRFVWIGAGYDPHGDASYSVYLHDQLRRAQMEGHVTIVHETHEIEFAYGLADVFMLSSRLDPLPNVAIDSMLAGVPVVCFDRASGVPEILRDGNLAGECVADYIDTAHMAELILKLVEDREHYAAVSRRVKSLALRVFNMSDYADQLVTFANVAVSRKLSADGDRQTIAGEPGFLPEFAIPPEMWPCSVAEAARLYVRDLSDGHRHRRPEPGFNPFVYASAQAATRGGTLLAAPYADFIRAGRPAGPWSTPVIAGPSREPLPENAAALGAALHIHAYYPDDLSRILSHLTVNRTRPALYVSVASEEAAETARRLLNGYEGATTVRVVPNLGRDIGPLLSGFGAELVDGFDVVGHVHTKRSADLADQRLVDNWTRFLFENVLGGSKGGAMLDRSLAAFADNPKLGLIYPSDPNIIGWGQNRDHAAGLAARLHLTQLPDYFDFPVGTMFWMRAEAFRPFVELGLGWDAYPAEPVAYDGTVLHALERLFGVVPPARGFDVAVTCVKGVTR